MIPGDIGILRGESPFFIVMAKQTPRQELLEAVEAYAVSKTVEDNCLQRLATMHLANILRKIDIVAPADELSEELKEIVKDKRNTKKTKASEPNEDLKPERDN